MEHQHHDITDAGHRTPERASRAHTSSQTKTADRESSSLDGHLTGAQRRCYICGDRWFASEPELDHHLDRRHAGDLLPYRCATCGVDGFVPIRSMRAINRHFGLHDIQERPHGCDLCALRFRTERNLQSHRRLYHAGGERNVKMDIPVTSDTQQQQQQQQHRLHRLHQSVLRQQQQQQQQKRRSPADWRRFQCCHCGAIYSARNALKRHENTHTLGVTYACRECGKIFAKLDCLTQHTRIHSRTRPYGCELCGKTFIQLGHLRIHMRGHTGERPHVCAICNRGFRHKQALTVHGRIHSGVKPFRCVVCEISFTDASTLRKHGAVHRKGARTSVSDNR
ncbi:zinc finger protein 239-like [Anopheles aquasalis]|uniref:zinc finger protein 239-like n=1 Tax=Anopheles aquasalis TaxID=42839 RepID=UPI00215B0944|nr:zinc finger protein 239-like [Anopheles aquasalis]